MKFRTGDKVKVLRRWEGIRNGYIWLPKMDETVGETYKVTYIFSSGAVQLTNNCMYSPEILELVKEDEMKKLELSTIRNIEVALESIPELNKLGYESLFVGVNKSRQVFVYDMDTETEFEVDDGMTVDQVVYKVLDDLQEVNDTILVILDDLDDAKKAKAIKYLSELKEK